MASGGRRKKNLGEPRLRVDLSGVTAAVIGSQAGLGPAEVESLRDRLADSVRRLEIERGEGRRPLLELAEREADLAAVRKTTRDLAGAIDCVVVVAGEGSGLGCRLLTEALAPEAAGPRLLVVDGATAPGIQRVLDRVDPARTLFHILARDGDSVETLANFLLVRDRLVSALGAVEYTRHLLVTTDGDAGPLRQVVNDEGLHSSEFPPGVVGHQAATSPNHLLGASLVGADIDAYLAGVRAMDARCREVEGNPAAALAAAYYLLATLHGVRMSALFPYHDGLGGLAEWWRHLWAATLGKKLEGESSTIPVGLTPVVARGTLDQYTQLQMYLDGPADKVFTFVSVATGAAPEIPRSFPDVEDVAFLGGHTLDEVCDRERRAVSYALARAERPSLSIELPALTPHVLGQTVRLFESAALITASLHDVDPQARPAVERTRRLVFGALGKPGFETEGRDFDAFEAARGEGWVV